MDEWQRRAEERRQRLAPHRAARKKVPKKRLPAQPTDELKAFLRERKKHRISDWDWDKGKVTYFGKDYTYFARKEYRPRTGPLKPARSAWKVGRETEWGGGEEWRWIRTKKEAQRAFLAMIEKEARKEARGLGKKGYNNPRARRARQNQPELKGRKMGWDVVDGGDRDAYMKEKLYSPFTFVVEASDDEAYFLHVTQPQDVNTTELKSRTLTKALEEADGLILSMDDGTPWGKAVWKRANFLTEASPVVIKPYREVLGPEGNIKRRHSRYETARRNRGARRARRNASAASNPLSDKQILAGFAGPYRKRVFIENRIAEIDRMIDETAGAPRLQKAWVKERADLEKRLSRIGHISPSLARLLEEKRWELKTLGRRRFEEQRAQKRKLRRQTKLKSKGNPSSSKPARLSTVRIPVDENGEGFKSVRFGPYTQKQLLKALGVSAEADPLYEKALRDIVEGNDDGYGLQDADNEHRSYLVVAGDDGFYVLEIEVLS